MKDWEPLPIRNLIDPSILKTPGTLIKVEKLYPTVAKFFNNEYFKNELRSALSEHFTVFLQKGLKIQVDEDRIIPVHVEVLVSEDSAGPAPYVFSKKIDDVLVSIVVGLNTGIPSSSEEEDSIEFEQDRSSQTAGWTVFCNDRAVIVGDKNRLTGWGDGIPLYHYQFSVITGIVEFKSNHADQLPVTTTKRALDTSSDIWLETLVKMKEGMRIWINYTNAWKNHPRSDQTQHWINTKPQSLEKAISIVSKKENATKGINTVEFNPQKQKVLPEPPTKKPSSRRITYSKPLEEIRMISTGLFDSDNIRPSLVGEQCFDLILHKIKEEASK